MNALLTRIARRMSRPTPNVPAPGCDHANATGIDDLPADALAKVWQCVECGFRFRYAVVPGKPWFIADLVPVETGR